MNTLSRWAATLAAVACLAPGLTMAQPRGHARGWHGDIHRFERHDLGYWRGGYWRHGLHDGRLGWWWIVGGFWYFYPTPVYPYPDPYTPPVVVAPQAVAPAQPSYWYYCDASRSYYPYVASCEGGWRQVPATPPAGGTP